MADIASIKRLAEQRRYNEALEACENFLNHFPERKAEVLRIRAYVFSLQGEFSRALNDREAVFAAGEGTIRDYYLGADDALSAREFDQAVEWLNEVLRLGKEQNEHWFDSAACFFLSDAYMELGQHTEAISSLDRAVAIESDIAMPIPHIGMCTAEQLRAEIKRRSH